MEAPAPDSHDQFLRHYVQNEEALRGFVRSLVPTLEDSREVMQEVAVVLWKKFDTLDAPENFRRWAFGVARFQALAFRRDKARDRHVFSEELIGLLEAEASTRGEVAESEAEALEFCLTKLTGSQRTLVETAYKDGTRIDEMAKEAGRTPMALYKTLHRIRIALADCIENTLDQEESYA